jgi:DnaJ-domain-containing protein 1
LDGEPRRFEGSTAWASVPIEVRDALASVGPAFKQALLDEDKRRRAESAMLARRLFEDFMAKNGASSSTSWFESFSFSFGALSLRKAHLSVLELPPDADAKDVKAAYRKLAMKYHPDRPTGDEAKFKDIKRAYDALQCLML